MAVNSIENKIVNETRGNSKYNKGGTAGIEGVLFQVDLLTVTLLNAYENHRGWKLSTENKLYGKFDDVVLELQDGAILLQAKHRKNRKLLFTELFSTNSKNNDFSLGKYFFSYQEIKVRSRVKYVAICTNSDIKVDNDFLTFLDRKSDNSDAILYHPNDCSFYKFNDSILAKLEEHVRSYYNQNFKEKGVDEALITPENLSDFLNHLKLYCNYPSEEKLNKIIEQFLSRIEYARDLHSETSSKYIHNKMLDWFRQPQGIHLEDCQVTAMISEMRSNKYCEILEKYNVFFNNVNLAFKDKKRIIHVISKDRYLLNVIKIYRALQSNENKIAHILFVSSEDSAYLQYFVGAFELPQYTHLIIIWPELKGEKEIKRINLKLRETLDKKPYKKVILASDSYNKLASEISMNTDIYDTMEACVTFKSLSTDTQLRLLKNENIIFQGKYISLEELFSVQTLETCDEVLDPEIMEKLIKSEKVKVGSPVKPLDEHIERYYVPRRFQRETSSIGYDNKEEVIDEGNICDLEDKLILIVDGAGTGKSTVLTNLAITIKNKLPCLWVIRINLNDYTSVLNKFLKENRKAVALMDILQSLDPTTLSSRFERSIFSLEQRVLLMLDGVDEICPDYMELVLSLIFQCQKASNFSKIFVTTRPQSASELEKKLNVKSLKLQSFTIENQVYFLTNYWMHSFYVEKEKIKKCEDYARALINKIESWNPFGMRDRDHILTAVPLHIRMLAEIFESTEKMQKPVAWIGCREYLNVDEGEPRFPEEVNIAQLYKMFILKKRDIFIHKGNPTGTTAANRALDKEFEESLDCHRSLALEVILDFTDSKCLSCYKYVDRKNMEVNIFKIGIIQHVGKDLHFIHRTFAEYFVAESILIELQEQRTSPNRRFQQFFIDNILWVPRHNIVRTFLDNFLQDVSNSLPSDMFRNNGFFNYRINLNTSFYNKFLIHKLAEDGCVKILQFLFKCISFKTITNNKMLQCDVVKYPLINRNLFCVETLNFMKHLTDRCGINLLDQKDRTPLTCAVQNGHLTMVKFLLEHEADVNSDTELNTIADADIVEHLIKRGAYVHSRKNILHLAAEREVWPILKILLENGADVNADKWGYTVLHVVVIKSHLETVKYLVQNGIDVNVKDSRGVTPLLLAIVDNQLEIAKVLIESGADVNVKDNEGATPLHRAVFNDQVETIKFLIQSGADVNVTTSIGQTSLHLAVFKHQFETVKFLIQSGANVNVKTLNGATPLHLAVFHNQLEIVHFLLQSGANVNSVQNEGFTALHLASLKDYDKIVKSLVEEYEADINIRNCHGCKALDLAIALGHQSVQTFLLKVVAEKSRDVAKT